MPVVSVVAPWRDNWYTDAVLDGLRRTLAADGHVATVHVVPYGGRARETATDVLDDDLAQPDCIGAVVIGFRLRGEEAQRLLAHGKPVVASGGASPQLPSVRIDDVAAARLATEHLIGLGHRSIAHLAGYTVVPHDFPMCGDRVRGYTEAMQAAGLEGFARVRPSAFEFESARVVAHELLREADRPTAIFSVTDELAYGVLAAARDLGLDVPGDLSVAAIDDHPDSAALGLTTVGQVPEETGVAAVERLLGRRSGELQSMTIRLVERSSAAAPRAARPAVGLLGRLFRRG